MLDGLASEGEILTALKSGNRGSLVDDIAAALGAVSLELRWTQLLPITTVPDTSQPWTVVEQDPAENQAWLVRLDGMIDELTNPVVVSRIAEILWWASRTSSDSYQRYGRRALDAHQQVLTSASDPTSRLMHCWSGAELARYLGKSQELDQFRNLGVEAAFELVTADYPADVAGLRMHTGLGYLFGIVARWRPLRAVREVIAIAEIAARRHLPILQLSPLAPSMDWIERLRFLAAGSSDVERARVIVERAERKRAAMALWPKFDQAPPDWDAGELSLVIEEAAEVASRLKGESQTQLAQLTSSLVVALQDLGWRFPIARDSMVSSEDVTEDARRARVAWEAAWTQETLDLESVVREIGQCPSPLDHPEGLNEAATALRPRLGPSRGRIQAMGFVLRDTAGGADLDELALAEACRHRLQVWGEVVADRIEAFAAAKTQPRTEWFLGQFVSAGAAERFAASLQLFLGGDFDAAAHVSLPRLEAGIREMAVRNHVPALQIAYRNLGDVDYLASLLAVLESLPDRRLSSSSTYLRRLLIDNNCAGLRNVLSHGLREALGMRESVSRAESALLIHAAALLANLGGAESAPAAEAGT